MAESKVEQAMDGEAGVPPGEPSLAEGDEDLQVLQGLTLPDGFVCNVAAHLMVVSFLPGLGACIMDTYWSWSKRGEQGRLPALALKDAAESKRLLQAHFKDVEKHADPRPACAAPVQISMESGGETLPRMCCRHPDVLCCWLTWWIRPLIFVLVPSMLMMMASGSKPAVGTFILSCAALSGAWALLAVCLRLVCSHCCGALDTIGFAKTIAYVLRLKQHGQVKRKGLKGRARAGWEMRRAASYLRVWCGSVVCCKAFYPSRLVMLTKVLLVMMMTELLMPISVTIYVMLRFSLALVSWRACTAFGLTEEAAVCASIKKRLATLKYDSFEIHAEIPTAKDEKPEVEATGCCGSCMSCKACMTCASCGSCCSCWANCLGMCSFGCAMCSPFCEIGMDLCAEFGSDLLSAVLIIMKSDFYCEKIVNSVALERGRA